MDINISQITIGLPVPSGVIDQIKEIRIRSNPDFVDLESITFVTMEGEKIEVLAEGKRINPHLISYRLLRKEY